MIYHNLLFLHRPLLYDPFYIWSGTYLNFPTVIITQYI